MAFLNGVRVHKRTPATWCTVMRLLCLQLSFPADSKHMIIEVLLQMRALKILSGLLCPEFSSKTKNIMEDAGMQLLHNMDRDCSVESNCALIADLSSTAFEICDNKPSCTQL